MEEIAQIMMNCKQAEDFVIVLETLHKTIDQNTQYLDLLTKDLVDFDLIDEVKSVGDCDKVNVYFGKTLRDLKLVLKDEDELRVHEVLLYYKAPKTWIVSAAKLPSFCLKSLKYNCITDVIVAFRGYLNELNRYFYELDHIDQSCTVLEPTNPSYKDDYRRILIDDRVWLHVEVTHDGLATNVHLVGNSEYWNNKLQNGLLSWDHDKNIVDNILAVFELTHLPQGTQNQTIQFGTQHEENQQVISCGICLCDNLPDAGVPQPLCQNPTCGVYYHRMCLYQWLVACAGSRPPAFGVANGACPTCLQPVTCSEKDS